MSVYNFIFCAVIVFLNSYIHIFNMLIYMFNEVPGKGKINIKLYLNIPECVVLNTSKILWHLKKYIYF